ncbi:MAG: hypothetical protein K2P58_08650 [Hyphomonadaceae bacterium]|nr:hypothetical protein [Hyphomonadaceae bacterium]
MHWVVLAPASALLLSAPAHAETQESDALRGRQANSDACVQTHDAGCFLLMGLTIDGANAFTHAALADAYEPHLGQSVNVSDLALIAEAITARYRQDGYFLSRAIVPEAFNDGGVARIVVLEGRIDDVSIEGNAAELVRPFLGGLELEPIARLDELDRRLALASDVPGVSVRSQIEPNAEDPTAHRLVVTATLTRQTGYLGLDNRGAEDAGPVQAYGRAYANSAFTARDQFSVGFFATPSAPGELSYGDATYTYVREDGGRWSAQASVSRTQDENAEQPGGDAQSFAIRYDHPLLRRRDRGLWLGASFELKHAESDWFGGGNYTDELRVARFALRGFLNEDGHATTVLLRSSVGLDFLGASEHSAFSRSRADADATFVSLNVFASHYRDVGRFAGVYGAIAAQWADRPLLVAEEFFVGGPVFGRAYDPGEIAGDRGVAGLIEVRAGFDPELDAISLLQGYVFADVAEVWNFSGGADSVASAGLGMRVSFDDWLTARMEVARPLTRTPAAEGDKDLRQFFSLIATY